MSRAKLHPAARALKGIDTKWSIKKSDDGEYYFGSRHYLVGGDTITATEANAKLISVAPEMLSFILDLVISGDFAPIEREKACDIIRRASNNQINF